MIQKKVSKVQIFTRNLEQLFQRRSRISDLELENILQKSIVR